jgi:hypothetical protein
MTTNEELIVAQIAKLKYTRAAAAWKAFLESTPPNVPVKIDGLFGQHHPSSVTEPWSIASPEIEVYCETDGGIRSFAPETDCDFAFARPKDERTWTFVVYTCKNCGNQSKVFCLLMDRPRTGSSSSCDVMKFGEFPSFGPPISPRIKQLLGESDLELYRKGMRSEDQGLGIGAATYFRRIVDNHWRLLVAEVRDAAAELGATDLSIYDAALQETQFSKAVEMLKRAIPPRLLILGGENPLTLLYRPLSSGLHGLTDERCLQQASDIRVVLTALLENIADVMKDRDELKDAAARLKQGL